MGCTQSKVEEESVTRCKERKHQMKAAVSYRNAFAAAHAGYTVALKNTGAALSDYGQGEALDPRPTASTPSTTTATATATATAATVVQPPSENVFPPPPPFNAGIAPLPLQRAASMPDLPIPKPNKKPPVDTSIREEEDEDEDLDDVVVDAVVSAAAASASPPPPPPPQPSPSPPPPPPPPPPSLSPPPPPVHESKGIENTFNFIFGVDTENMPGPSLSQPEEPHSSTSEIQDNTFKKTAAPPPAATPSIDTPDPPVTLEKAVDEPPPLKTTRKQKQGSSAQHQQSASAGGGSSDSKKGRIIPANSRNISILEVLHELDEHFLKAYESAHQVSKMLEATRMHYHSNFADNRGHIDHSARVMRVITWNRSLKGIPNADDGKDDFDSDEWETHATILDKMLAWEKKLYDEVKAGELMKIEYQRKVALLNKQKKRGVNPEALEKTKSVVSHLHTRYIVDMQSMDSTVSEINRLRDDRLYPKLVELVDGMANMWETMFGHHVSQLNIMADLRNLDVSLAPKETSEQHHGRTIQLLDVLKEWHSQFDKLMTNQIAYIRGLNGWLKLNLIPIESNLKEKVSSPPRVIQPPIQTLLHAWNDQVDKLPVELASGAIKRFSEVVNTIVIHQGEELKQKEKCEEMHREHLRKARAFEDWKEKYLQKRAALSAEEADSETREGVTQNDPLVERQIAVEAVKLRLESELEDHRRLCKQVRDKSLGSLKTHLPELFRAISDFAFHSSNAYKMLRDITQSQNLEE